MLPLRPLPKMEARRLSLSAAGGKARAPSGHEAGLAPHPPLPAGEVPPSSATSASGWRGEGSARPPCAESRAVRGAAPAPEPAAGGGQHGTAPPARTAPPRTAPARQRRLQPRDRAPAAGTGPRRPRWQVGRSRGLRARTAERSRGAAHLPAWRLVPAPRRATGTPSRREGPSGGRVRALRWASAVPEPQRDSARGNPAVRELVSRPPAASTRGKACVCVCRVCATC